MVLLEIDSFLDSRVRSLTSPGDSGDPEPDLIPCALLSGYYLRTVGEDLSALPQIQAETARIWDDLAFLQALQLIELAAQVQQILEILAGDGLLEGAQDGPHRPLQLPQRPAAGQRGQPLPQLGQTGQGEQGPHPEGP